MCGIFGEFTSSGSLLDKEAFMKLNKLSYLRGPDSSGHFTNDRSVQLGFNRLAILDLSANGDQPMHSPSGRYTIVFNGEVYNHLDIRKKLLDVHTEYRGTSDTETIVTAMDYWGLEKTVSQLDGMFGMAIYDHHEDCIHLIRDFAGIKPLHYGLYNNRVVFASQYNQVSHHPEFISQPMDESVLKLYLRMHYIPAPLGILKNTYQVLPGEIVTITNDFSVSKYRYWELTDQDGSEIFDEKAARSAMDEALDKAVQSELLADVPLGAFLSGGIDSPLICHFASKHFPGTMQAFTIGSDSKLHDESEDAETYASFMQLDLTLEKMEGNAVMNALDEAMKSLSEPFADPSIIPTFLVSKLARKKVTVALSGDGGDELFFGYERFWSVLKNRPYHHLPYFLRYFLYAGNRLMGGKRVNGNILLSRFSEGHFLGHSRMSETMVNNVFPDLSEVKLPEAFDVYSYSDPKDERALLAAMRKAEFYGMMQKTLLKVDRASMANSLEIRVPFLKKSFIEASLKVDPMISFGPDKKKELLKSMLRSYYPKAPIDNRKRGFSVPLQNWIRQGLKPAFEESLFGMKEVESYFNIDRDKLNGIFKQHLSGEKDLKWPLFTVYSLMKWKQCLGK